MNEFSGFASDLSVSLESEPEQQNINLTLVMPEAPQQSLRYKIGKNVLDVAKLAGGIFVAGYLLRKTQR